MASSAASEAGPEAAFASRLETHRAELRVHCYRMLGSLEEAEELVQETFLRSWRARRTFRPQGPSSFRAWLYRIATNACIDALRRRSPRLMPEAVAPPGDPDAAIPAPADLPWLQPYPSRLLEDVPAGDGDPGEAVVARETIELAFLAAIQHLPPRQRAALIYRDVLGFSAKETASHLETSVPSANSALQRARETLRERLGERNHWVPGSRPSEEEAKLLQRYLEAHERADVEALGALLREDARLTMPPHPIWFRGREAILIAAAHGFGPSFGELRSIATAANLQPAAAQYLRVPGECPHRALTIDVLRVEEGQIVEIASFVSPELFGAFGLPATL